MSIRDWKRPRDWWNAGARTAHAGLWSSVMAALARAQRVLAPPLALASRGTEDLDFSGEEARRIGQWLDNARETSSPFFKRGVQGGVYLCDAVSPPVIVKAPARSGVRRWVGVFFLRREFRAYRLLRGAPGVPRCHGLWQGRYLVLERVEGVPRHEAVLAGRAREIFFDELFALISELHRRGVAHGDMQNRNNLLVVDGVHPCLVDFGAAEVRKGGFAPLSRVLFRFLSRRDFNVWVKLKYAGRVEMASEQDRAYYRRTRSEKAARWVKSALRRKGTRTRA